VKILVTGGHGLLGRTLSARGAALGHAMRAPGRLELDITRPDAIERALDAAPDLVVNAAACADVDASERDPDRAFAVNAAGPAQLARACERRGVRLVHVSTDYVFDGATSHPYREDDPPRPLNVYGASKLEGERAVLAHGASVVRTSWILPGFAARLLALAAREETLRMVSDQIGCPTVPDDLADALVALSSAPAGVYHYCSDGPVSRYDLAVAVLEHLRGRVALRCVRIDPVASADMPSVARRPAYTALDTSRVRALGIAVPPWRTRLEVALRGLA
jgi:dTDP-4-dehydrorhamnose reductase